MPFASKIPLEDRNEFLRLARERYSFALQFDAEDRHDAEIDQRFAVALEVQGAGTTQWDPIIARKRIGAGRPCLTENRLQTFTAQVVNDGRQNKPSIRITALDNGTKETAEYYQGRIRQIEYDSQADVAYDSAREQQVASGRAFVRVTTEWEPGTFRQRARIERIENQFSVVYGPSRKYDCSDADYCFVISLITKEEHARRHGKDTIAQNVNFASFENPAVDWLGTGPNGELIQEAEYWVKEYKPRKLCLLSNGNSVWEDEMPQGLEAVGITVVDSRMEQDCTVTQYIIDGAEILDETEFLAPHIPIVPVWGRESWVEGKRRTQSLIRYAKDPQRLLNLYVSNIAEQIAQMPKTPFMVPVGGIPAGSVNDWAKINSEPLSYLYFQEWDPETNRQLSKPSRVVNEPPIQALVMGYNQCVDAIKAAMGIFDASLGNRGNETSGIAITKRQRESDNANFHFPDNEARSRHQVGVILLCLMPRLDAGKGDRAIRSEDGKTRIVRVGEPYHDEEFGKTVHHDLSTGNYGVASSTGPSYTSQRAEAFAVYSQIATADKSFMSIAGDKVFRNMDAPGSEEIADRYEKMLPPQLAPQKNNGQQQIPPQVQQQLAQYGQMVEGLTSTVHQLQDVIDTKRMELDSRERICEIQESTKREIAIATLSQNEGLELLRQDLAAVKHRLELQQAEDDRQHRAALQQGSQEHAADMQSRQQYNDAELQARNQQAQQEQQAAEAQQPESPEE